MELGKECESMDIRGMIRQMTLEEKAGLCSGQDFWRLKAVERLGLPNVMVSDGPHGLRKQDQKGDHLGLNESIPAVCFPTGAALACSFDRDLISQVGRALGAECQAEDVAVVLGPAVNIKRSPLCGRNFEYLSEDPYLAGQMAAGHIQGVQSQNVGVSLKHFAANNQETRRMSVDAVADERTLREIYLSAFETAVKQAKPWTLMCSYNKINGVYSSDNEWLLNKVLREEWGFEGFVMTDWGAVHDRVTGLKAGLELEMPSSGGVNDQKIVEAVREGRLDEAVLDRAVERILNVISRYLENRNPGVFDREKDHALAREVAARCMVLLKNEGDILPLKGEDSVAFIGGFAKTPRYQGGGSSHINASRVESALEAAQSHGFRVRYAQGYAMDSDETSQALLNQAVELAGECRVAVVFAGLPDAYESEGYDRTHMDMPPAHNELIRRVSEANPNTVVVLHNGSPVTMPWLDNVKGVLEAYLGGQAVGGAVVELLYGLKNPCGRLAETFPIQLSDNPSYLNFPGNANRVEYREGVFVGYRYYDKKQMAVRFPFGYGLSYTRFEYSGLAVDKPSIRSGEPLSVRVRVKNVGSRPGREVVELYVAPDHKGIMRPVRELKGFESVLLQPGEEKEVCFELDERSFAYYETRISDWYVEPGRYLIQIGRSSRDIALSQPVDIGNDPLPVLFDLSSTLGELMDHPVGARLVEERLRAMGAAMGGGGALNDQMRNAMMRDMPLSSLPLFSRQAVSEEMLLAMLKEVNGE